MAMVLRTAYTVALSLVASSAGAEQFSWQLSGSYSETELSSFADTERTMLDATYYLDPVDDTRGPYSLAPFLNRSSRVTGGVSKETTTITVPVAYIGPLPPPGPTAVDLTEDTTGYTVGGRYVWAASGWYVGAAYRDLDTDQEQSSPLSRQGTTSDGYELFGGRYFGESTSLDLTAGTMRQRTELTLSCITSLCLSGSTATQIDTDDWSIGALHVRQKPRLSYTIAGRVSGSEITPSFRPLVLTPPPGGPSPAPFPGTAIEGIGVVTYTSIAAPLAFIAAPFTGPFQSLDERKTASIAAELFPTDRIGFRIGLARSEGEYGDDESYDLAATWFFTRATAVEFVLARTQSEIFSLSRDIDSAELRLFGRL